MATLLPIQLMIIMCNIHETFWASSYPSSISLKVGQLINETTQHYKVGHSVNLTTSWFAQVLWIWEGLHVNWTWNKVF